MALRILIADDAGFIRDLLTQACEALGHIVVGEAVHGEQVIEMATLFKPDVILMDLVMPRYNGIEATQKIFETLPDTIIVACSSMDDETTLQQAQDIGCQAFLRKPFTRQSLKLVFQQIESQRRGSRHA
jgi:two-component system chemotaxis response regulator CheY